MCANIFFTERHRRLGLGYMIQRCRVACEIEQKLGDLAGRRRLEVAKIVVVIERGHRDGRRSRRCTVISSGAPFIAGLPRFQRIQHVPKLESVNTQISPSRLPELFVIRDPLCSPADSGVSRNIWDRKVCQYQEMEVSRKASNES